MFVTWYDEVHATVTPDNKKGTIDKSWILLDSQSTVDLFWNLMLLKNIRRTSNKLVVMYNAGKIHTNLVGDLPGYGTVWYYQDGISKILSLNRASSALHVQYDSNINDTFMVWKNDGTSRRFTSASNGSYYCNPKEIHGLLLAITELDLDQIDTIRNNMEIYNQR